METISYYDNVKDNVQNKGGSGGSNFDTLKKAAQEHSEDEKEKESKGDGTSIEILEDGLQRQRRSQTSQSSQSSNQSSNPMMEKSKSSSNSSEVNADMSGVEEKLDTLIEQNRRMIEILESFGSE